MSFDPRCLDARVLDFHWRAKDDLAAAAGLTELGRSSYRRARNSVLASLVLAGDSDRPWVSYSRSSDFYAAEGRYEGTDYSLTNLKLAVAEFTEAGLITEMRSAPGSHLTHGFQSRMIATDRLMSLAQGADLSYVGTRCPLVMKDEDGTRLGYRETAQTQRLVAEVEDINRYLGAIEVGISPDADPADWKVSQHNLHARKVKGGSETWTCVRPTPSPEVFRVFGRGRWDRHGRWYGWWQNLPKARRAELLINGEFCVEPDFACLHPTLLYAMRGAVLQHDPYEVKGWDRSAGKLALNVALNAKSIPVGIKALLKKRREIGADGAPKWVYGPAETLRIVEAVQRANPVISKDIGSDAGIRLMSIDSGIAHAVMKRSRAAGISVLPVHDSFIAPRSKGPEVNAIMGDVMAHTISTISPAVSMRSMQSIRYTPQGGAPEERSSLPSLEETSSAEPVGGPSPEAAGYPLPLLETPSPEAVSGPAGEVTAPSPEGLESPLPEAPGVTSSLLATPFPEAAFRPVLAVRRPFLPPSSAPVVIAPAPLPPASLSPPVPAPASAPVPLPPFLAAARAAMHAEAEAAAAAARAKELSPPRPRVVWAPLPPRVEESTQVPLVLPVPVPVPRPDPSPPPKIETPPSASVALPSPVRAPRTLTLQEVGARARSRLEARMRDEVRNTFR